MRRNKFVIVTSTIILLMTVSSCTSQSDQANSQTQPSSQDNQITPSSGSSGSSIEPVAQASVDPSRNATNSQDSPFMMTAAQGGMSEVQLGQLAQQKASSPQVKQFAQRMVKDHGQANTQLMQIFQQKTINPPSSIGARYSAMREQLRGISGAEFDQKYMSQMLEEHTEDVTNFQREVSNGKDPDVKAWATQTLPTLRAHLQQAQTIHQNLTTNKGQ